MFRVVIGLLFLFSCQTRQEKKASAETVVAKPDSIQQRLLDSLALVAENAKGTAHMDSLAAIAKSKPIWGERERLTGDFDGDGTQDTLYEKYISQLTGKETNKNYDFSGDLGEGVDWLFYWQIWIGEKKILLKMVGNKPEIKPWIVDENGLHDGFLYLKNVGDLNQDSTDEIVYILNNIDFSNGSTGVLVTYKNGKWKAITSWNITEHDFQYDPEKQRKPDPKYIFAKPDGSVFIKEFDGNKLGNTNWKRLKTNW